MKKKLFVLGLVSMFVFTGCTKKAPDQDVIDTPNEVVEPDIVRNPDLIYSEEAASNISFSASYPKEVQSFPILEQAVLKEITAAKAIYEELVSEVEFMNEVSAPWDIALDFGISFETEEVISLFGGYYSYTGGAHGNVNFISLNYDKEKRVMVSLEDLFIDDEKALNIIADFVRNDLQREGRLEINDWFLEGTAPIADNYQIFTFASSEENNVLDGIGIHFPPYQIAAYSVGASHVFVPASVLKDVFDPEFTQ